MPSSIEQHHSPIVKVMTWNMAEGFGSSEKIQQTFGRMHRAAETTPTIIALQEAHVQGGHIILENHLQKMFPNWKIVSFTSVNESTLRETHGHIILLSPEISHKQDKNQVLPQARQIYDLFVEEKHKGRRRGVQVAVVDVPHGEKLLTVVIANAHLDLDVRGGKRHKGNQVFAVSKAVTLARQAIQIDSSNQEVALVVTGDWNSGRRPDRRWHRKKMERIERELGDSFVEATDRRISASIPRSIDLFFASKHATSESQFIKNIFHEKSLLRRGLAHIEHRTEKMGKRSLDHVYTTTNLIPGEWFEIDEGASDHKVIGVTLFAASAS